MPSRSWLGISLLVSLLSIHLATCAEYNRTKRQAPFVCGSDPYRFFSEFPCNLYPTCSNGGFKLNVGCTTNFQCTPYAANAVCVANCCCSVPIMVGTPSPWQWTTTRIFYNYSFQASPLLVALSLLSARLFF
ncbi:unnamed protein product [Caenorhabditis auriculariae]|uniref:Uncharacterized protein n=1 Tax=Caenorhabditis auriculariae TaxID=2777116 RepID=A0A8S1HEV2_9PELO|nr:unnamed protein product [Caenorhabditis auriculariae]